MHCDVLDPAFNETAVDDTHTVDMSLLPPIRVPDVNLICDIPDPTTVTLTEPVLPTLWDTAPDTETVSSRLIAPDRLLVTNCIVETTATNVSVDPATLRLRIELLEVHVVDNAVVFPSRDAILPSLSPSAEPTTVTDVDPVEPMLVLATLDSACSP